MPPPKKQATEIPTPIEQPKEWTPEDPLEDAEAETEANDRAKAHARYEHLKGKHLAKLKKEEPPPAGPKKFKVFDEE